MEETALFKEQFMDSLWHLECQSTQGFGGLWGSFVGPRGWQHCTGTAPTVTWQGSPGMRVQVHPSSGRPTGHSQRLLIGTASRIDGRVLSEGVWV